MSLRTPLGKVRGLGSAKSGTEHWWMQRVTAIANIPLTLIAMIIVISLVGADHATVTARLGHPLVVMVLLAFIGSVTWHMRLGMQVVIEDYIHTPWMEMTAHLLVKFAMTLGMVVSAISILRVVL